MLCHCSDSELNLLLSNVISAVCTLHVPRDDEDFIHRQHMIYIDANGLSTRLYAASVKPNISTINESQTRNPKRASITSYLQGRLKMPPQAAPPLQG